MFEKVNPSHPDKVADRIAGALVDLAYKKEKDPRIAVEVLIGHGVCHIIAETSVKLKEDDVYKAVQRISGITNVDYLEVPQDKHLAKNQDGKVRCGDNGIFRGVPVSVEENDLTVFANRLYDKYPYDGKFIVKDNLLVACQSHLNADDMDKVDLVGNIAKRCDFNLDMLNPLGSWLGGCDVDSGATNRKLGSDMGSAVTGGGLHGKDLSKADVSINIYAHLKAEKLGRPVELVCAIGDEYVDGLPYAAIVEIARDYIQQLGGFEKFAEWGLIR